jgi:hypothetical protein
MVININENNDTAHGDEYDEDEDEDQDDNGKEFPETNFPPPLPPL